MKAEVNGFKIILIIFICVLTSNLNSQIIQSGEIIFERRTNLEKRYEGTQMGGRRSDWIKKPKIDEFKLYFDKTSSLFKPLPPSLEDEDREWATMKNTTFQDFSTKRIEREFSYYGSNVYLKDTLTERQWIITGNHRNIAGYDTKQALWIANDSTRIYAWYAEQIITQTGPESFNGLPGTILGLAMEDGGVVYFAKEVKPLSKPNFKTEVPKARERYTYYNKSDLEQFIIKTFSGRGGGSSTGRILDDLFVW